MSDTKNIYEKLLEVKKAGIKLQKDTEAYQYKYATLSQIQEKLGEEIQKQKLVITHAILDNRVVTTIVDAENPEDIIKSEIPMTEGTKAQDKGSEISYYRRYNLLSLFDLEVEDDDGKKAQNSGGAKKTYEKKEDTKWFNEKPHLVEWTPWIQQNTESVVLAKIKEQGFAMNNKTKDKIKALCKK